MKRLVLNKWYGGISSDPNIGNTGSVYNIEGLDIHSNSKYIQLAKGTQGPTLINTRASGQIIASLYESNTGFLELSYDGYLTYFSGTLETGGLGDGCNIGKITIGTGTTYGFLITTSKFSVWAYNSSDSKLGYGTPTSTTQTFNQKAPYVIYSDLIYIGNGNKITKVDMNSGSAVITDALTIDKDYTIVGISRVSDQFFIYASNGSNGRQYLWDGISIGVNRVITWVDKPIQNIANFGNIDYLIVGTSSRQQICLVNGYQLQPLIVSNDYIDINNRLYFNANYTNSIETIGNKILFGGNGGIFSFGNKTPGLSQALTKEFLYIGGSLTNIFYSESISFSIFAYMRGTFNGTLGNYRTNIYLNEKYGTVFNYNVGFIELQPIFGDTYSNIKTLEKITIGAKLEEKTFINFYVRDLKYATFYTKDFNSGLQVGAVYTYDSRTFTILNIINDTTSSGYVIHCSYTGNELTGKPTGTFTKSTGFGPTTMYTDLIRYGYKLIGSFTNYNLNRFTCNYGVDFKEIQFAIEIGSFTDLKTPKLYDINLYYNEDSND